MSRLINPDEQFFDNDTGAPLALGTLYFGEPNQDPETNPKAVYSDAALTTAISATQPLTADGKPQQFIYLKGDYSLTVRDSGGAVVFTADTVSGSAADIALVTATISTMKGLNAVPGQVITLTQTGRAGQFVVKSGTPPSDPQEGVYVVLDNGNYAMRIYDGISSEGSVNAQWFGATGDGSTDDTAALQAAIDHATGTLFIPEGHYITSDALVVDKQLNLRGIGSERTSGQGTQIRNEGVNEGLIYSDTVAIYDRTISNIGITSVNGHGIHIKNGAIRCEFLNVRADSRSANHSALYGDYTSFGAGIFTCRFIGGEYFGSNTASRNVPIIDFLTDRTLLNENVFRDMWISYSKGIMAMRIQATDPGVKLTNNKFESITFEVCEGGLIRLSQCAHTKIDGVSAWDSPSYTGNLITLDDCTATTIIGYGRIGGTPDAGVRDILAQGTGGGLTVISFSDVGAADESIDWGGQTGTYIGAFSSTRVDLNASRVVFVEGDNVKAPNVISPNHTAENGVDAFLRATGDAEARLSSEHTGSTRTVSLDANAFYGGSGAFRPDQDSVLDLGASSVKWKNVHAVGYRANGAAGVSGTFTTVDSKTVTVTNGIITNIA